MGGNGSGGDETGPGPGSQPPQFLAALPLGGFSGPLENTSVPSSPLPGRPPGPSPLLAAAAVTSEDGGRRARPGWRGRPQARGQLGGEAAAHRPGGKVSALLPTPTPTLSGPHRGPRPARSPPGALESSRKTLGRPHRALQRLSSRTSCCDCLSCRRGATKAMKAQPTGPPWASSRSRNLVSSPRKPWGRSECQPECREDPGGAEGGGRCGGQGRPHLDGGLLPLAALKAQGLEYALQESDCRG